MLVQAGGESYLIDAGRPEEGPNVVDFLRSRGVDSLDGIVVDTHVRRVSGRLGLTESSDPVKIEQELMGLVPEGDWTSFSHLLILHGRRTCKARKPDCPNCILNDICPSAREYKN